MNPTKIRKIRRRHKKTIWTISKNVLWPVHYHLPYPCTCIDSRTRIRHTSYTTRRDYECRVGNLGSNRLIFLHPMAPAVKLVWDVSKGQGFCLRDVLVGSSKSGDNSAQLRCRPCGSLVYEAKSAKLWEDPLRLMKGDQRALVSFDDWPSRELSWESYQQ